MYIVYKIFIRIVATIVQQEDLPNSCQYMVLSDHLDMVRVQLRATWVKTRKANDDVIQDRVSKTINP